MTTVPEHGGPPRSALQQAKLPLVLERGLVLVAGPAWRQDRLLQSTEMKPTKAAAPHFGHRWGNALIVIRVTQGNFRL
jgi:hypothetical protein